MLLEVKNGSGYVDLTTGPHRSPGRGYGWVIKKRRVCSLFQLMKLFRHAEGRICKALDVTVAQQKIVNSQQFLSHTDYCLMVSRITEDILREIYLQGKGTQHSGYIESHVPNGQGRSVYHKMIQIRLQRTDKSGDSGCLLQWDECPQTQATLFLGWAN